MVNYAKCVTVRDQQILQKKSILNDIKRQNEKIDTLIEIDRLKKIKDYEANVQKQKDAYK